jgi:hypothetical protein
MEDVRPRGNVEAIMEKKTRAVRGQLLTERSPIAVRSVTE